MYYIIIILWDHRRICDPSLTETSLCCAWLYIMELINNCFDSFEVHTAVQRTTSPVIRYDAGSMRNPIPTMRPNVASSAGVETSYKAIFKDQDRHNSYRPLTARRYWNIQNFW